MRRHVRERLQRAVQRGVGAAATHSIRAMPGRRQHAHSSLHSALARIAGRGHRSAGVLVLTCLVLGAALIPAQAGARGPSVTAALSGLEHSGAITEAAYRQYTAAYAAANGSLKKLSGTRRAELAAVIANTQGMAAAGAFIPTRLPVIFLTLEKNRQWWTTQPLVSSRVRVSFPPSKLVWEYYAGQGIQIQWLGTFGEANGYYLSGHENTNLKQLLSEVLPLATKRAGGIAWEYMFHFDGGAPPWTSGLSQGTALQVMARSWSRFKEQTYRTAAQQALGISATAPPQGVRVKTRPRARSTPSTPTRPATASSTASSRPMWGCMTTPRSPTTRSGCGCSKKATPRRAPRPPITTRAPGRCMTSTANRTSTTTNC